MSTEPFDIEKLKAELREQARTHGIKKQSPVASSHSVRTRTHQLPGSFESDLSKRPRVQSCPSVVMGEHGSSASTITSSLTSSRAAVRKSTGYAAPDDVQRDTQQITRLSSINLEGDICTAVAEHFNTDFLHHHKGDEKKVQARLSLISKYFHVEQLRKGSLQIKIKRMRHSSSQRDMDYKGYAQFITQLDQFIKELNSTKQETTESSALYKIQETFSKTAVSDAQKVKVVSVLAMRLSLYLNEAIIKFIVAVDGQMEAVQSYHKEQELVLDSACKLVEARDTDLARIQEVISANARKYAELQQKLALVQKITQDRDETLSVAKDSPVDGDVEDAKDNAKTLAQLLQTMMAQLSQLQIDAKIRSQALREVTQSRSQAITLLQSSLKEQIARLEQCKQHWEAQLSTLGIDPNKPLNEQLNDADSIQKYRELLLLGEALREAAEKAKSAKDQFEAFIKSDDTLFQDNKDFLDDIADRIRVARVSGNQAQQVTTALFSQLGSLQSDVKDIKELLEKIHSDDQQVTASLKAAQQDVSDLRRENDGLRSEISGIQAQNLILAQKLERAKELNQLAQGAIKNVRQGLTVIVTLHLSTLNSIVSGIKRNLSNRPWYKSFGTTEKIALINQAYRELSLAISAKQGSEIINQKVDALINAINHNRRFVKKQVTTSASELLSKLGLNSNDLPHTKIEIEPATPSSTAVLVR